MFILGIKFIIVNVIFCTKLS